jgi:outer membrane protein
MYMNVAKSNFLLPFLMLLTSFCTAPVAAEDLKVGYIDTAKVLKDAPQADLARKKLEDEFNPRDQEIVNLQHKLKELTEKQEREAKLMSQAENIRLERDIVSVKRDIKRAKEEFNEDFNLRRNEELAKLHKLISKTTVQVAKELKYDIVLSDNVLYITKRVDITDIVLKRLQDLQKGPRSAGATK